MRIKGIIKSEIIYKLYSLHLFKDIRIRNQCPCVMYTSKLILIAKNYLNTVILHQNEILPLGLKKFLYKNIYKHI